MGLLRLFRFPQCGYHFSQCRIFGGFALRYAPDPQLSATRGRVLWCTLVPAPTRLLDYRQARY